MLYVKEAYRLDGISLSLRTAENRHRIKTVVYEVRNDGNCNHNKYSRNYK